MKIGLITGCFDIIHPGHIKILRFAKSVVDVLIVGVDGDDRVREKKGDKRPINTCNDRREVIRLLPNIAEHVYEVDSDERILKIMELWNVNVRIVGSDWKGKEIVGGELVEEIRYFPRDEKYSTSKILEQWK